MSDWIDLRWELTLALGAKGLLETVVVSLPLVAALCWPVLLCVWYQRGQLASLSNNIGFGLLAVAVVVAGHLIGNGFSEIRDAAFDRGADSIDTWRKVTNARFITFGAMYMVGLAGLIAVPLFTALIVRGNPSEGSPRCTGARMIVPAVTIGAMLWTTALGLFRTGRLRPFGDSDAAPTAQAVYDWYLSAYDPLDNARLCIWAIAALGTVGALTFPMRNRSNVSARAPAWTGCAIAAAGLLLWVVSRSASYDARHPLAMLPDPRSLWLSPEVPSAKGCSEIDNDLLLEVTGDSTSLLNGSPLQGASALREPLLDRKKLWQAIQPGQSFPGFFLIAARPETPTESVQPYLDAARDAGYGKPLILVLLPQRTAVTRTLGVIQRHPHYCAALPPSDKPWPKAATWGALVADLEANQLP